MINFSKFFRAFLFLISCFSCFYSCYGIDSEYQEKLEQMHKRIGSDIQLKCGLKSYDAAYMTSSTVQWYFKFCRDNFDKKSCQQSDIPWLKLSCDDDNACKPVLILKNVTENNSGLYKCTVYPYRPDSYTTLGIQLVRTYQLNIQNSTVFLPKFLDNFPQNHTSSIGSQVVFQCRVYSKVKPTIKWFRQIGDPTVGTDMPFTSDNLNSRILKYSNSVYELLESAREKILTDDVYLSKHILNSVTKADAGFYACVAINYKGHDIREAYLDVTSQTDIVEEEKTNPTEFLLLFLMPVGLAMIPLSFWGCFIFLKKISSHNVRSAELKSLRRNV